MSTLVDNAESATGTAGAVKIFVILINGETGALIPNGIGPDGPIVSSSSSYSASDGSFTLDLIPNKGTDNLIDPSGTCWLVIVAGKQFVIQKSATNGETLEDCLVMVPPPLGTLYQLGDLSNVDVTGAAIDQVLTLDSSGNWVASDAQGGTLDGDVTGPAGGNAIVDGVVTTAKLASGVVGGHLSTMTGALDPRLVEQRQNATRRSGVLGASAIQGQLQIDVVIGDSIARGVGGDLGSSDPQAADWATVACITENRLAGLPDPGPGLVLCNEDEGIYGSLKWNNRAAGSAGTTGPSAGAQTAPASNWELTANNQVAGDSQFSFRRAIVFYEKQASGPNVQVSKDGGSTFSTDQSTAGTAGTFGFYDTGDLSSVAARTLQVKRTSAGSVNARLVGHLPLKTAGTSGAVTAVLAHGGTATADWTTYRGWENFIALLNTISGARVRRVTIALGGNDALLGVAQATAIANLDLIVQRAKAAVPLAEVELVGEYYVSDTAAGKTNPVSLATWSNPDPTVGWVAGVEKIAITRGCTFVNQLDRFGDCSDGADPYGLTIEPGLHFGSKTGTLKSPSGLSGQQAHADLFAEVRGRAPAAIPAAFNQTTADGRYLPIASPAFTGTLTGPAMTLTTAHGGRFVVTEFFNLVAFGIYANGTDAQATLAGINETITAGPGGSTAPTAAVFISGYTVLNTQVSGLGSLATLSSVDSAHITDGTIVDADVSSSAAIANSKIAGLGSFATNTPGTMTFTHGGRFVLTEFFNLPAWGLYANGTDAQATLAGCNETVTAGPGATTSPTAAAFIAQYTVPLSGLATQAADTVLVNATGSSATPTALAMAASTILARLATGDIVAATTAQIKTLLAIASGDVSGLGALATLATVTTQFGTTGTITMASGGRISWGELSTVPYWALYNNSTDTQPSWFQNGPTSAAGPGGSTAPTAAYYAGQYVLSALAAPTGDVALGTHKFTGHSAPSASGHSARWDGLTRTLFTHFADQGVGADTTEDTLYTDTLAAGQLATNGDVIEVTYAGTVDSNTTGTKRIRAYFGGTVVFDTTAVAGTAAGSWQVVLTITRVSATAVNVSAAYNATGFSAANVAVAAATFTKVTGLTLANTQIVKVTGQNGTTATANRIVASSGVILYQPAAL